jgi:hypothetical protein
MNNNAKTASNTTTFQKYYGVGSFEPIMVNPTAKDLGVFLNRQIPNEPQYLTTKNIDGTDVKSLRIDVWGVLPKVDVKTKVTFWLEGRHDVARSGKTKMINGQGFATYVEDASILNKNKTWYFADNMRKCLKGEDQVVDFFIKLMNWETDLSKFTLKDGDTPQIFLPVEKLFKGDFSDLQQLVLNKKTIKVYCGIKSRQVDNNTYYDMEIYSKAFMRDNPNKKGAKEIIDALMGEYSGFSGNIAPISETLEEFNPESLTNKSSSSSSTNTGIEPVFTDDNPFTF